MKEGTFLIFGGTGVPDRNKHWSYTLKWNSLNSFNFNLDCMNDTQTKKIIKMHDRPYTDMDKYIGHVNDYFSNRDDCPQVQCKASKRMYSCKNSWDTDFSAILGISNLNYNKLTKYVLSSKSAMSQNNKNRLLRNNNNNPLVNAVFRFGGYVIDKPITRCDCHILETSEICQLPDLPNEIDNISVVYSSKLSKIIAIGGEIEGEKKEI